jgi:hypothetical protein
MLERMDLDDVLAILRALADAEVDYVVVGAVALNFHGLARATADLDVFVAPDRENIDRLRRALDSVFGDPAIGEISADDLAGSYPAVQYVPPDGLFHVDILTRLGEVWSFEDIESEEIEIEGVPVKVATPLMLYRMKRDTVRLQDQADAERLKRRFKLEDQ